jgi:hypothetical protein
LGPNFFDRKLVYIDKSMIKGGDRQMKTVRPLVPEEIRLLKFPSTMRLNAQRELYANSRAMAALESTAQSRTATHLLYDQRSETEIAIHWVEKGTEGALPLKRRHRAGRFSFSPVLVLYPFLKVQKGRIRQIAYRIDETPEGALFVLDLTQTEVTLATKFGKARPHEATT